jgi:hypothetical protein
MTPAVCWSTLTLAVPDHLSGTVPRLNLVTSVATRHRAAKVVRGDHVAFYMERAGVPAWLDYGTVQGITARGCELVLNCSRGQVVARSAEYVQVVHKAEHY